MTHDVGTSVNELLPALQGWSCPNCGGNGTMMDGSFRIGPKGLEEFKPSTQCWVCKGRGRVRITPWEE